MNDTILAYLISLAIIGTGVCWIVVGTNSTEPLGWIALGVLTIAVGLISFLTELRHKTH